MNTKPSEDQPEQGPESLVVDLTARLGKYLDNVEVTERQIPSFFPKTIKEVRLTKGTLQFSFNCESPHGVLLVLQSCLAMQELTQR
jgi:hypothetical protein